ncbi:beta-class carbonic anhydrase [Bacillus kwashiorkori]|uniref:beta-class carbonic anhydrase n=1 Tax=Bacillus kwashiorkori TaxID=1522318 RepID=UPI00078410EB|nr:carbonic anhydrase [Bacillus kwashiorkori]
MTILNEIMDYNEKFVQEQHYLGYTTSKYPNKRMVILTCMDARLLDLLPKAMNLKNGDAKILRNAGAILTEPFGSMMRSILVAVYELKAEEVLVIGHHDCGMSKLDSEVIQEKMLSRGIKEETLAILNTAGISMKEWLTGFANVEVSVKQSVKVIKNHPLLPKDVPVHGLVIHPDTGKLDVVVNGYGD